MENEFKYTNKVIWFPFIFVFMIWLVYWLQIRFDFDFAEKSAKASISKGLPEVVGEVI